RRTTLGREQTAAQVGVDARRPFDDQGAGGRVIAERVEELLRKTFFAFLLFRRVDAAEGSLGSAPHQLAGPRPLPRLTNHFADQLHEDRALVATLEAELATEVTELPELATA